METKYYIHKSVSANFSSLTMLKGKSTKEVFTSNIAEEEVLFGVKSWDTRIRLSNGCLFDTLQEALTEFRLVLQSQLEVTVSEVSEVQKFLAGE